MKHLLASALFAACAATGPAAGDPSLMLGGTVLFGGGGSDFGVSARVLSDDEPDAPVVGAGVTYYFGSGEIGADVMAGVLFDHGALGLGYDFLREGPVLSIGAVNTDEDDRADPPAPEPDPAPEPEPILD